MTDNRNHPPGPKNIWRNPGQSLTVVKMLLWSAMLFCPWWISPVRTYRGPELPLGEVQPGKGNH